MFDWIFTPDGWIALVSLLSLEIVLGIDNIIFISILVSRLPQHQQDSARIIGLSLAMISRLLLLASLVWIMGLTKPVLSVFDCSFSGRDLILVFGGLFLIAKATFEIHHSLEIEHQPKDGAIKLPSYSGVLIQIAIIDVVFSLDSVITAVGMVEHISIMVIAVLVSIAVMMTAAKAISNFVGSNPSIKMLALSFLMMIGFALVAEGFQIHIPKGYIYFAMAFSLIVELLNIRVGRNKITESIELSGYIQADVRPK